MELAGLAPRTLAAGGLSPLVADLGLGLVAAGVLAIGFPSIAPILLTFGARR